ncbi:MAG: undecaprenyl-diphosphate phosphatase [Bacteroidales bacterium]|jgi:undecaprenyl-diphosphatase|nr:undecaprenyl-diphosphate phosphatase [Bacteroidales bacterium]MDD2687394.1 undecaprenyl-diphosphate phosphatase [Bacteroidales bacterium]MDD3329802.1 undecaprenyl-diphosphate phosphatase [Bacteroidales bacterium]MDD3690587.1 undecaprenyl-diphosphate phosphatase [Bacteroidales bacterium]MDD4044047.1 undecaprenyl-diphosphate phosphatase [Bacteroidales bacterium]
MEIWEAIVLGIVQGLAEFLPISSSGHLVIGSAVLGVQTTETLTFTVAVHAATVLSTIVVLWKEIAGLFKGLFSFTWNDETVYLSKIALSMIPVMIVGLFFKDVVEEIFGSGLLIVGVSLLLTALLLSFAYFAKPRQKEKITWFDAFLIGVAQAFAVLPGLSRSGSTIATGLLLGNKKESVAKFSFLMVLVPILGEAFLDIKDYITQEGAGLGMSGIALFSGFLAAFITGCFACKWMINVVKKGKLIYFAIYCLLVAVFTIIYYFV